VTIDISAFADFNAAARAVLAHLHQRLGMQQWMVTRSDGGQCIVLQAEGAEVGAGVKASISVPLYGADGRVCGALCGIDSSPRPTIADEQPLLELLGGMLNTILRAELTASAEARRIERLESEALTDPLTGTYNRRCWNRLLASEEERCRRHGHPAAILMVDLDGLKRVNDTLGHAAGDTLLVRAGAALRQAVRPHDIVARLGGDEFGILSVECDRRCGETLLARVRAALADAKVPASVGLAVRSASIGLAGAWEDADQFMYQAKRSDS
jgi:diguanylate cyclase (GGDEF)-like protein